MAQVKQRPRVGDEAWVVEWCVSLAFDEGGDVDRDNCRTAVRRVATRAEAEALAREVWPQTTNTFGVVDFWPVRFEAYDDEDAGRYPHVGSWQATDDGDVYEGPEEEATK